VSSSIETENAVSNVASVASGQDVGLWLATFPDLCLICLLWVSQPGLVSFPSLWDS